MVKREKPLVAGKVWPVEVKRLHAKKTEIGQEKGRARQSHRATGRLESSLVCREDQAGGGGKGEGEPSARAAPSSARPVDLGHSAITLCLPCGYPDICCLTPGAPNPGPPPPLPSHSLTLSFCPQVPRTCRRMGRRTGRCSRGRASGGGGRPAELPACLCPRMLCLAGSTNSRLTIKDSAAEGKQVIL